MLKCLDVPPSPHLRSQVVRLHEVWVWQRRHCHQAIQVLNWASKLWTSCCNPNHTPQSWLIMSSQAFSSTYKFFHLVLGIFASGPSFCRHPAFICSPADCRDLLNASCINWVALRFSLPSAVLAAIWITQTGHQTWENAPFIGDLPIEATISIPDGRDSRLQHGPIRSRLPYPGAIKVHAISHNPHRAYRFRHGGSDVSNKLKLKEACQGRDLSGHLLVACYIMKLPLVWWLKDHLCWLNDKCAFWKFWC